MNKQVDLIDREKAIEGVWEVDLAGFDNKKVVDMLKGLPSVTPQEPVLDKINKMKSEIADSLEFWDYSPNNNPLARDMLETLTNFWGDLRGEEE